MKDFFSRTFNLTCQKLFNVDTICGNTNKLNRDRWLQKTLSSLPEGSSILDAGAGELQYREFCKHLKYTSQDFCLYDGKGDGKGLQSKSWDQSTINVKSNITDIPVPDSSYDAVLCVEVLEHLPYPIKALKELSRILKPQGFLILTAPFCSLTHQSPYHFYTGFNRYFYQTHLEENGFEILELECNGNFFEYLGQEIHRIPSVAKEYAGDRPNRLESYALQFVLKMLERLSGKDQGSDELLCFGYHVLARKLQ